MHHASCLAAPLIVIATAILEYLPPVKLLKTNPAGIRLKRKTKKPIYLRPRIEQSVVTQPFTLRAAVEYAQTYYPNVLKSQSQVRAAKRNVTIQKNQ